MLQCIRYRIVNCVFIFISSIVYLIAVIVTSVCNNVLRPYRDTYEHRSQFYPYLLTLRRDPDRFSRSRVSTGYTSKVIRRISRSYPEFARVASSQRRIKRVTLRRIAKCGGKPTVVTTSRSRCRIATCTVLEIVDIFLYYMYIVYKSSLLSKSPIINNGNYRGATCHAEASDCRLPVLRESARERASGRERENTKKKIKKSNRLSFCTLAYVRKCARSSSVG